MNKWLKLFSALFMSVLFIGLLYGWFVWDAENKIAQIVGGDEITMSEMALTLLTKEEAEVALSMPDTFNSSLPVMTPGEYAGQDEEYAYTALTARNFSSNVTGELLAEDVLMQFGSDEDAENFIKMKAEENGSEVSYDLFSGEEVVAMTATYEGDEGISPYMDLRFAVGNMASRITIYGNTHNFDVSEPSLLISSVLELAIAQKLKMDQILAGDIPGEVSLWESNMAFKNLPGELTQTELVGLSMVNKYDWMGEASIIERDLVAYVSGAYERFELLNVSGAMLDVTVMEFEEHEDALAEQATFFTEGAYLEEGGSGKVQLPESLNEISVARSAEGLLELQAVKGVYLYDIFLSMPFAEDPSSFNRVELEETLIQYSEEILLR